MLLVAGSGGSGRSALLRELWSEWKQKTPTVWVDPGAIDDDADSLRPVLVAIMQGLSDPVRGYAVEFPRVVLAHIAMQVPVLDVAPDRAHEAMRTRMNVYRDRAKLIDFLGELIAAFGSVEQGVHMPGYAVVADAVARDAAQRIADRLRRSPLLMRFTWDAALRWFGHQDTGLHFTPETALVQLNRQAHIDSTAVRRGVDDLLVGALLADLRESLAKAVGRPHNALVLLDEGDTRPARAFVSALVRIRRGRDPRAGLVDPLVVVTTSGGALAEDLPGEHGQRSWDDARLPEMDAADLQAGGLWLPIRLGCLRAEDTQRLAKTHDWPAELGAHRVAAAVHRLTGGYAEATERLLGALAADPKRVEDVDAALRSPFGAGSSTLEDALFTTVAEGLTARGRLDEDLREMLVTIAAARDLAEAERLPAMLGVPMNPAMIESRTMWSAFGPRGPALPTLVRDLGLRALARRPEDHPQSWERVFTALRDGAERAGDQAGRLHHELALGNRAVAVDALTAALPDTPDEQWLALLDEVTAAYDPSGMATVNELAYPVMALSAPRDAVDRLVSTLHALSAPRLSARETLRGLYLLAENDYRMLAGLSLAFVSRARQYRHLADALE